MNRHEQMRVLLAQCDRIEEHEREHVMSHLAECEACRSRVNEYAAQTRFLRTYRLVSASGSLQTRVLHAIESGIDPAALREPDAGTGGLRPRRAWLTNAWRRPWTALSIAVALVAAMVLAAVELRTAAPASAEQLLQAAASAGMPMPSTGSATFSYYGTDPLAPFASQHRVLVQWAARDPHHYHLTMRTIAPAIDAGTVTTVANGSRDTEYDSRLGIGTDVSVPIRVARREYSSGMRTPPFSEETIGSPVDLGLGESIQRFLRLMQQDVPASVKPYARIVESGTYLGRPVHVVRFAPVVRGTQCLSTRITQRIRQPARDCSTPDDYGVATVWIDDVTHVVLRYRAVAPRDVPLNGNRTFSITSFSMHTQILDSSLSAHPNLPIRKPTWPAGRPTSGVYAPGLSKATLPGFPHSVAPTALPRAWTEWQVVGGPMPDEMVGVDVRYTTTPGAGASGPYAPGMKYVFVRERTQIAGLPRLLQTGIPMRVGGCRVWGQSRGHGATLALARNTHSVVMVSNVLSVQHLRLYAARRLCE